MHGEVNKVLSNGVAPIIYCESKPKQNRTPGDEGNVQGCGLADPRRQLRRELQLGRHPQHLEHAQNRLRQRQAALRHQVRHSTP